MVVLTSERLILKALTEQDLPALFEYYSNQKNFPFSQMPVYKSIEDVEAYLLKIQGGIESGLWYAWGLYLSPTGTLIGSISLWNFSEDRLTAEFGYGLFPHYRGHGYMCEALSTCMHFAFNDLNMKRLEAYTQCNNLPSIALLEKNGYVFEKTVTEFGQEMSVYSIER